MKDWLQLKGFRKLYWPEIQECVDTMKSVRQYEQGYTVILPTLQKWFKNGLVSGFVLEKNPKSLQK